MKLLGWQPSHVTYVGGYEDNKRGKARERRRVQRAIEAEMTEPEREDRNQYGAYVTSSAPLAAAGHPYAEEATGPCGACGRAVPTCAACCICRDCHGDHLLHHLLGLWATWQLEVDARTLRLLQSLSGVELTGLSALADHHPHLAAQIRWEQNCRHALQRMAELDCQSYCSEHDCDSESCPPGAHE